MACTALTDILKGCDNNIGGITKVYLNRMSNITAETIDTANKEVTARTVSTPYVEFEFGRNAGSYTEESQINIENGSTFWIQKLMLKLFRREASKSKAIQIAAEGQDFLSVIALDSNGIYWDIPNAQLTNDTGGSGTAKADGSNYDIEFTAENLTKLNVVDPIIIAVLL